MYTKYASLWAQIPALKEQKTLNKLLGKEACVVTRAARVAKEEPDISEKFKCLLSVIHCLQQGNSKLPAFSVQLDVTFAQIQQEAGTYSIGF